jgi:hypothetical protein
MNVVPQEYTDISEEHIAYIFSVCPKDPKDVFLLAIPISPDLAPFT